MGFVQKPNCTENCVVNTTALMSNQPKQNCVKRSLFEEIHHVALRLNHHMYPFCQLGLQTLEILRWVPVRECQLLIST